MQYDFFELLTPRKYRRKPFLTHDIRQVRELYIKQNLPGKEVAELMGRSYLSFRQFVQRHPELHKGKKGGCR
jgi:hypothetical protein